MNLEIATLDLTFRRRSTIGYTVGMAVYVLIVVALYPAFRDSAELDSLTSSSPGIAALFGISGSLTSPTGWLNANIYANFFPLIVLLLTVGYGAGCLAGQEKDGHLELVLSLPFSRGSVVAQKVIALAVQTAIFAILVFLTVLAGRWFDLSVDAGHLATATVAVALLGVDFGLLAIAIGGATGNRGLALGVTSVVAAASFLVSSMAPLVSWLEPARVVSLFYWSVGDNQLDQGMSAEAAAVLVGVGVVLAIVAWRAFLAHDLS